MLARAKLESGVNQVFELSAARIGRNIGLVNQLETAPVCEGVVPGPDNDTFLEVLGGRCGLELLAPLLAIDPRSSVGDLLRQMVTKTEWVMRGDPEMMFDLHTHCIRKSAQGLVMVTLFERLLTLWHRLTRPAVKKALAICALTNVEFWAGWGDSVLEHVIARWDSSIFEGRDFAFVLALIRSCEPTRQAA
jgi:hypothetical protein